jgi:RNA polymerase sigma-54 factor
MSAPTPAELARSQESLHDLPAPPGAGAAPERGGPRALRFLIESLNDDGYLEDSLASLAAGLAGDDLEQAEELVHRFTMALRLLQSLEPVAWARATWANACACSCKRACAEQRAAMRRWRWPCASATAHGAAGAARHQALAAAVRDTEADVRAAIGLIGRWSPSRAGALSMSSATSSCPT